MTILEQQGAAAKQAARKLAIAGTAKKNEALEAIAKRALEQKTGARGLRAILEDILMQCMFDAPSESGIAKVIVNAACVQEHKQPLMLNQDGAPVGESA